MRKTLIIWLAALALMPLSHTALAEMKTWTSNKGKTVEGEIVKKDSSRITIKRADGKTASLRLSDLIKEDQEFVENWTPQEGQEASADPADEPAKKVRFKWNRTDKAAFKQAEETGLPILILFYGPSWNAASKKLDSDVIDKRQFKNGLEGVAIGLTCIADANEKFRGSWAQELAKKYDAMGVPKMVIIDAKGKQLGSLGYSDGRPPEDYVSLIKEFAEKASAK